MQQPSKTRQLFYPVNSKTPPTPPTLSTKISFLERIMSAVCCCNVVGLRFKAATTFRGSLIITDENGFFLKKIYIQRQNVK